MKFSRDFFYLLGALFFTGVFFFIAEVLKVGVEIKGAQSMYPWGWLLEPGNAWALYGCLTLTFFLFLFGFRNAIFRKLSGRLLFVWLAWVLAGCVVLWHRPGSGAGISECITLLTYLSESRGSWLLYAYLILSFLFFHYGFRLVACLKWGWRILAYPVVCGLFFGLLWATCSTISYHDETKHFEYESQSEENPLGEDLQRKIEAMRRLVAASPLPGKDINTSKVRGEAFDPQAYFSVLTNLSIETGYVLDFVHTGGANGFPVLYARKKDAVPCQTVYELVGGLRSGAFRPDDNYHQYWSPSIDMRPTAEAFLELAALHLIGNQFYLFWHANYNDRQIIASALRLEEIINNDHEIMGGLSAGYRVLANELDVCPKVTFHETELTVMVDLLTFTQWGGFIRDKMTFSSTYPYTLLHRESEVRIKSTGPCY